MVFDLSHAFEGDSAMARGFLRGLPSGSYYTLLYVSANGGFRRHHRFGPKVCKLRHWNNLHPLWG